MVNAKNALLRSHSALSSHTWLTHRLCGAGGCTKLQSQSSNLRCSVGEHQEAPVRQMQAQPISVGAPPVAPPPQAPPNVHSPANSISSSSSSASSSENSAVSGNTTNAFALLMRKHKNTGEPVVLAKKKKAAQEA